MERKIKRLLWMVILVVLWFGILVWTSRSITEWILEIYFLLFSLLFSPRIVMELKIKWLLWMVIFVLLWFGILD
uniref:Uncharacterized protein n=1 Tax=Anopheles dirus TaxID=7168 RepID=A0A182NY44_9DIPT